MKTIAIIIGVSRTKDLKFVALPGAQADARRFSSALISWGLPKEWIHELVDAEATKTDVIKTFYDCRSSFDADAKLIVYFAGHGIRDIDVDRDAIESALIMHDTSSKNPLASGLKLSELMKLIRMLKPAQTFLFIDACSLRLNEIENPLNDSDVLSSTNSKGLFCLFSSGIKSSFEDVRSRYGYFTSALLKALGELRLKPHANCHDLLIKVQRDLKNQALSPLSITRSV